MGKLYSLFNRRKNTIQPNLSRQRLNYNGPIESEILNLYYDQFYLDIARLSKNAAMLESKIDEVNDLCDGALTAATPGYYVDEDILMTLYGQKISYDRQEEEYIISSATPYYNTSLTFYKTAINSANISKLNKKLDNLEKIINIQ